MRQTYLLGWSSFGSICCGAGCISRILCISVSSETTSDIDGRSSGFCAQHRCMMFQSSSVRPQVSEGCGGRFGLCPSLYFSYAVQSDEISWKGTRSVNTFEKASQSTFFQNRNELTSMQRQANANVSVFVLRNCQFQLCSFNSGASQRSRV